jgi:hypothetical protein
MINGKVMLTKAVIERLAKELDGDPAHLQKLVDKIEKDLGGKPRGE